MHVVRPVTSQDIDPLFELIAQATHGMSTLNIEKSALQDRVESSEFVFARTNARPEGQPYVFVMENTSDGEITGTCAVYAKVGGFEPFYAYEIKTEHKVSRDDELGVDIDIQVPYLSLLKRHNGPTEIGSLYLAKKCWGGGLGRLLSLSRFLYIAEFPDRFESEIVAELRGVVNSNGESPLWNALGKHFFQNSYPAVETLTSKKKRIIAELMPNNEIYIPLLPTEAQEVIGQVHKNTIPARAMLESEGFKYNGIVDIFDGGPAVTAATSQVRTIKDSRKLNVVKIEEQVSGQQLMIANCRSDFRVVMGAVSLKENEAVIDSVTALRLQVVVGDPVRVCSLRA